MVDYEQITVTDGVGTVFCLALAMSVAGMAGDTAVSYPRWTKTLTGSYIKGVEMFEEIFTGIEVIFHASNILYGRSRS